MINEKYLKKYCDMLVRTAINVQKGQDLLIAVSVDCAAAARLAVEAAYKAGARNVFVDWTDAQTARLKYLYAQDDSVFDEVPKWAADKHNTLALGGAAFLSFSTSDPDSLKDVDMNRVTRATGAMRAATKPRSERTMSYANQWNVAGVPNEAWAKKVFPNDTADVAVDKLWQAVFTASRIDDNDAAENWKNHSAKLKKSVGALNNAQFAAFRYKNSLGTDLTVEMPENHIWLGGGKDSQSGIHFFANVPTEEVFSAPKRGGVNGTVFTSKPLVYNGNVIEDFSLTFKNGCVVDFSSSTEEGKKLTQTLLNSAENIRYLGEIALVPHKSPISQMNITFFNTLYDENASCHFALGKAYPTCLKGGAEMTETERLEAGINASPEHRDFMVGTADMSIVGITHDGKEVPVFVNGNFAPDFE